MFDVFFGFHSIQWSYSPVSDAGAAGFAPPALPGAAQGREGVLGISRNGDKRGCEHMSYFGAAAPKNLLLRCSIKSPRAGSSWWGSALTKKLLEVFVESLWHKSLWKKICLLKKSNKIRKTSNPRLVPAGTLSTSCDPIALVSEILPLHPSQSLSHEFDLPGLGKQSIR